MPVLKKNTMTDGERHVLIARTIRRARHDARYKGVPADVEERVPMSEIDETYIDDTVMTAFQKNLFDLYIKELTNTFEKTAVIVWKTRIRCGIRSALHFAKILEDYNVTPMRIRRSDEYYLPVEFANMLIAEARRSKDELRNLFENCDEIHDAAVRELSELL